MSITSPSTGAAPVSERIVYNGWGFPRGTRTLEFVCEPVKDSALRTIIYSKFKVTLECYLNLGNSTDALVQEAVSSLTQPAAGFRYRGRGMGDIAVNLGGPSDCLWGPFPTMVSLTPHGDQTVKMVWSVEFHIPTCGDARYTGPMEFNYSTTTSTDRSGYATRTYKGHMVIAQTRTTQTNRRVLRSADEWWEKIDPPMLEGFRRVSRERTLSEDKCRLDFSVVDEMMGLNAPPPRVVEAEASHTYTNSQPGQLFVWAGTLEAKYELARDAQAGEAVRAFGKLAEDRIKLLGRPGPLAGLSKKPGTVIPTSFTVADTAIYGKMGVHLTMNYRVAAATLRQILESGGQWRAAPDNDWLVWSSSLGDGLGPRGWAKALAFFPGEDNLVDLCGRIPVPQPKKSRHRKPAELRNPRPEPKKKPAPPKIDPGVWNNFTRAFPAPSRVASWIDYRAALRVETDDGNVAGVTLPAAPLSRAPGGVWDALGDMPTAGDRFLSPSAAEVRSSGGPAALGAAFVQQRHRPMVYVVLEGYAIRASFPVPTPGLKSLSGAALAAVNRPESEGFAQAVVGSAGIDGELPIFGARFRFRYLADAGDGRAATPPANRLLGA